MLIYVLFIFSFSCLSLLAFRPLLKNIRVTEGNGLWGAIFLFFVAAGIFAWPVFSGFSFWGHKDWDQFLFWNAVPRKTLLTYGQFPLWNPYANGGNVMLAHPHSSFLSPFYLLILFFGPVIGLKIKLLIHLPLGMTGMFLLSRHFNLSPVSRFFPPLAFMLCSIFPLHLAEGHDEWVTMAFYPWVFLAYKKYIDGEKFALPAIILLSLMPLAGSVYVFFILVFFLSSCSLFFSLQQKKIAPVLKLLLIFSGSFLLCAVKAIPLMEFLREFPRVLDMDPGGGINFFRLFAVFLSRDQERLYTGWDDGWHEDGAYFGIISFILGAIGAIIHFKKYWPVILSGLLCLLVAMDEFSPLPLWTALHSLPVCGSMTTPTRYVLGFVFAFSLMGGMALSRLEQYLEKKELPSQHLIGGILLIVFLDLTLVNSPLLSRSFNIKPLAMEAHSEFRQRFENENLFGQDRSRSSLYPIFLSNSGIKHGYEIMFVKKGAVAIESDPCYKGEVYFDDRAGDVKISFFSPNRITLKVFTEGPNTLVLNQNYHKGWKVKIDGQQGMIKPRQGLSSAPVPSVGREIVFYYRPLSFIVGFFVSMTFIFFYIWFFMLAIFRPRINLAASLISSF